MAEHTAIEWCDATFNPWVGCAKVSPGCAHCYAEAWVDRHGDGAVWGDDGVRRLTSAANWRKPLKWARELPTELGRRPRVFCASLADVFEPRPELDAWRLELYKLILLTPELDWLILTKRPEVARDWIGDADLPHNLWLGVSIENARHAWRADVLREIPAAVRFISAEPLLGSLLDGALCASCGGGGLVAPGSQCDECAGTGVKSANRGYAPLCLAGIDWLICGGESGPGHRPMNPEWALELRDACAQNGTAFFFKQDSGLRAGRRGRFTDEHDWPQEMPRLVRDATQWERS